MVSIPYDFKQTVDCLLDYKVQLNRGEKIIVQTKKIGIYILNTHTHSLTNPNQKRDGYSFKKWRKLYCYLNQNCRNAKFSFCCLQQKMEVWSLTKERRWIYIGYIDILERLWYLIHGERYTAIWKYALMILLASLFKFSVTSFLNLVTSNPRRARKYCLVYKLNHLQSALSSLQ